MTDVEHESGAPATEPAVPRVDKNLSTEYIPPRTDLERRLAAMWAERLNVRPVGVDDDFFELGGHSLAAAELLVDIASATGVEVSAQTLFLQPSIAELAAALETGTGAQG
ncbi:phosphopantetheine-binding protein [Saccharopolyspora sp. NPDC050389]|uniref:phosphopantetheine-binding protein n=1 Tax=Saccharopolyspora sp. NPDC050389 TaxID=3155516 RepID=UPI0034052055